MTRALCATLATAMALAACAPAAPAPRWSPTPDGASPALPPVPPTTGALVIDVVYPAEAQTLGVRDSTFIFGNLGTGGASLAINGAPVDVAANGAFLAFLPVPDDGAYRLTATRGGESVSATRRVELPTAPAAAALDRLSIVPGSIRPREALTETEGRPVQVSFRGTPGGTARLVLPGGRVIPLGERPVEDRTSGFMLERTERVGGLSEYAGTFAAREIGGPAGAATLELILEGDTVRVPLEARVSVIPAVAPRIAVAASSRPDETVIGTALAGSGTPYNWFFPNGAVLRITGTRGGQHRVALTDDLEVWVDTAEVRLLPAGIPAPAGSVGTVGATSHAEFVEVRLSSSDRLPFRVDPREDGLTVTVYGAETRTNWLQYGATDDPLIRRMHWEQDADDRYRLEIDLAMPLWGYLADYDEEGNIAVRVRRPPALDPSQPLRGLYIGVDAGHPPGGAIGPTRYTEAEANLAIARSLAAMLRARGARVLETRPDTSAVGLGVRPQMATDSSVHLLVSVHNNAFPDGVDPWARNGTSVFYNQAQSLELARELQLELLGEFGLRDLGIARADLALVRPTWMPSALTETMFLMVPRQEAALRDPAVQDRIARAHLRALERFVRGRIEAGR
jgi:N-acetylmuramoyl-L-alanine amidase